MIGLDRRLEIVTQQIIRAKVYFDIWWFYKSPETRPQIIKKMNDFSEFYRFDEHAHFVAMIIHCGVIWDRSTRIVSLKKVAVDILVAVHIIGQSRRTSRRNCSMTGA